MTTSPTDLNRSGTRAAQDLLDQMLATAGFVVDDTPGPGPTDLEMRLDSIQEAMPVGSVTDRMTTPSRVPLLDSLGGRLAYERGGVRLYDALLRKAEALAHLHGLKDCVDDLRHIRAEEAEHADLLQRLIATMGGDPTLETPCADLEGVMSSGLLQVVHDPRTSLVQCLRAAVVAELADIENWTMLVMDLKDQLSDALHDEVAEALTHEQEHLAMIRKWLVSAQGSATYRVGRAQ